MQRNLYKNLNKRKKIRNIPHAASKKDYILQKKKEMIFESRIRRNLKDSGKKSFPNTYENPHYKEELYQFSGYRDPVACEPKGAFGAIAPP